MILLSTGYDNFYGDNLAELARRPEAMQERRLGEARRRPAADDLRRVGSMDRGKLDLGAATDSVSLTVAQGSHRARITALSEADREIAFARLQAWAQVTPVVPPSNARAALTEPAEPRLPPAMAHALRLRSMVKPQP